MKEYNSGDPVTLSLLVYGPNGSGKTMLLGSATECFDKVIILTVEKVPLAMKIKYPKAKIIMLDLANDTVEQQMVEFLRLVGKEKPDFVGIDSLSALGDYILLGLSKGGHVAVKHWLTMFTRIRLFAKDLHVLCPYVVWIGIPKSDKDKEGYVTKTYPYCQGQVFPVQIAECMQVIGYLDYKEVKLPTEVVAVRTLKTIPDGKIVVRDSTNLGIGDMESPTIAKIFKLEVKKDDESGS